MYVASMHEKGFAMATVKARVSDIPLEELERVEDSAFEMLHMDREMVMEQFDDIFEDTDEACRGTLRCKGMYRSFAIEEISGDAVRIEGGVTLSSSMLASALAKADEVVLYAGVVHGYEELAKAARDSMFDGMFYDAWGVGYTMGVHRWIKNAIGEAVAASGRHAGRGWVPGEGDLELGLLRAVFAALDPGQIGLELLDSGLMRPVMAVCGIIGLSDDPTIADVGTEIVTYH